MTDLEISKALALAIGWAPSNIVPSNPKLKQFWVWIGHTWKVFDYRDPAVIWPIAERYSLFPSGISPSDYAESESCGYSINTGAWECLRWHYERTNGKARGWVRHTADTAAKAVAFAVIGRTA